MDFLANEQIVRVIIEKLVQLATYMKMSQQNDLFQNE